MAIPMLLQRALVRVRTWIGEPTEVDGLILVGLPGEDQEPFQGRLSDALTVLGSTAPRLREELPHLVRVLFVTEQLKNVMAPYGAVFIPGESATWKSTRKLAGSLVWNAEYIRAAREIGLSRKTAKQCGQQANQSRSEFFRLHDLVFSDDG